MPMNERKTWFFAAMARSSAQDLVLRPGSPRSERTPEANLPGYDSVNELVERPILQHVQHRLLLGSAGTDVPTGERVDFRERHGLARSRHAILERLKWGAAACAIMAASASNVPPRGRVRDVITLRRFIG